MGLDTWSGKKILCAAVMAQPGKKKKKPQLDSSVNYRHQVVYYIPSAFSYSRKFIYFDQISTSYYPHLWLLQGLSFSVNFVVVVLDSTYK